jgi:hypothetical protein
MSASIVSLEEVKRYLNISDDSSDNQLNFFVDALVDYVYTQTGRYYGCTKTTTEIHDYAPVIFLENLDIASIAYVKHGYSPTHDFDDDTENLRTIDPEDYRWNSVGRVMLSASYCRQFSPNRHDYDQIVVKYSYGVQIAPADLKLACLQFISDGFRNIEGEVTSEALDSFRRSYKPSSQAKETFMAYSM